jgi:hypothetical protein
MLDIFPHTKADQPGFSARVREACELVAEQTDLLKNGKLSDEQLSEYMLRQGQIRALILALGRDQGKTGGKSL